MSTDDISTPLRRRGSGGPFSKSRISGRFIVLFIFSLFIAAMFGWLMMNRDPLGGEPRVITKIKSLSEKQASPTSQDQQIRKNVESGTDTHQDHMVEKRAEAHSKKTEKTEEGAETPPDRVIISGGKEAQSTSFSKPLPNAPIEGYFKRTKSGLLPQISKSGQTPAQAYARPLSFDVAAADKNKPRIAILITGMGISPTATGEAIRKLPGAISLAFAPYANNLQTTIAKARNRGHEVMLQLPMEPFDYPDNDPGPHTLLAETSTRENNARIEWLMTRFAGYTGVTNYMGAKFTASPEAIKPFLKKIKKHGLFYFEDGSSARSQSSAIGKAVNTPFSKADLVIDGEQNTKSIRRALLKLENIARDRNLAIGVGSALPITIDSLDKWSKSLKEKGIILIPISATALSKK